MELKHDNDDIFCGLVTFIFISTSSFLREAAKCVLTRSNGSNNALEAFQVGSSVSCEVGSSGSAVNTKTSMSSGTNFEKRRSS